jgi:outer membrane receptor for ferrienterochelin and colicin
VRILFLLWLSFLTGRVALAQELLGQLRGTVVDDQGLAVPGAVVNATSPQLMGGRSSETDAEGDYRFSALPPGDYTVEALKPGMRTMTATARVVTGMTARVDLVLVADTASETLVVQSSAPAVDTTAVQSGAVVTREMLRDIPNSGRDYQSAMTYAPGVVGAGNANIRGGMDNADQFFVDGVNTTDPLTNTFSMNMNLDAIEEVQVITGGMDAEYGRALGGVLNIVTESGGNEFHGDVQLIYSGSNTQAYKRIEGVDDNEGEFANETIALNLGGPIVTDQLWFFAGVQGDVSKYTLAVPEEVGRPTDGEFAVAPRDWKSAYLFGKVTWQPSDAHRIALHGQMDPTDIQNGEQYAYTLSSGESWQKQGGSIVSLSHTFTPSDSTIVESTAYMAHSYLVYGPMAWRDCQNLEGLVCQDELEDGFFAYDPDGFNVGNLPYGQASTRPRYSLNSAITQYFHALGEHEAKAGFQAELLQSHAQFVGFADGFEYWSHNGDPTDLEGYTPTLRYEYDEDTDTVMKGTLVSAYVQDVWQPVPRLTLRPGLRLDTASLNNDVGDTVFETANLGPRIGVAYDLTGDGRTRAHGYYGRFYDVGWLAVSDILASGGSGYSFYYWDDATNDWSTEPAGSSADAFLAHDDLQSPHSDEFDIGITRDVGGGWAVGITGVYEETNNIWEDDDVNLIWNDDGTDVIGYRNGVNESIYRLRTPDEVFNKYTSLELTANRQFTERWGMLASYTWSRTYGYYQENDASIAAAALDIVPEMEDEVGIQPYDRPHAVKIVGSYRHSDAWTLAGDTKAGFLFGWNFLLRSGSPYGRLEWNDYYGGYYNLVESLDGTYRLPTYSDLDLKGGLTLARGEHKTLDLTLECFNVFNDRTVTSVDWTYSDETGAVAVNDDGDALWGTPLSYQEPRYFQLGLRGEF